MRIMNEVALAPDKPITRAKGMVRPPDTSMMISLTIFGDGEVRRWWETVDADDYGWERWEARWGEVGGEMERQQM